MILILSREQYTNVVCRGDVSITKCTLKVNRRLDYVVIFLTLESRKNKLLIRQPAR